MTKPSNPRKLPPRKPWIGSEDELLRLKYPNYPTKDIARMLGRSVAGTHHRAKALGLSKSEEYLASPAACRLRRGDNVGAATRFKKGQEVWNKGLKGLQVGGKETQFKKGNLPHNHVSVGTILPDHSGYLRIKVAEPDKWEFIHRRVWQAARGPIPRGHRIWWKDGDHNNCSISNLELLSGAEHIARTTVHRLPKELALTIQLAGALKRTLRRRLRGEKQDVGPSGSSIRDAGSAQG